MSRNLEWLKIDLEVEAFRISQFIRKGIAATFRKRGAVVAVSGGIDSSTTAALCVRALGPEHVFALLMPEKDSSRESLHFGKILVQHLGIPYQVIDIGPILESMGCYQYRDEAIYEIIPEYSPDWKNKIVLTGGSETGSRINFFSVVVESPEGVQFQKRLPWKNYLQVVAATNMKQRTRKSLEYFHADRLNYAVAGTPNLLEYDQGFFVKLGDGAADLKPIAHLYKTQVYAMARHLGLPEELCTRQPTTDTYSLDQTQEEFFFQAPHQLLDLVLWGFSQGLAPEAIAVGASVPVERVNALIKDIQQKRQTTEPLHLPALTVEPVQFGQD